MELSETALWLAKANTQRPSAESDLDLSKERRSQEDHFWRPYWPLHLLTVPGSLFSTRPANQTLSPERKPHPNAKILSSNGCLAIEL